MTEEEESAILPHHEEYPTLSDIYRDYSVLLCWYTMLAKPVLEI